MKIVSKVLLIAATILTGLVFIYSAYTKIYSLESFESFQYSIVEYVKLPWLLSALGARALIGLEAALGILITLHLFGKNKWILKLALALLAIFSIYLVYLWIYAGNDINCGCFGDAIWMSPSTSLIKNAVLGLVILLIIRYHRGLDFRYAKIAIPLICIGLVATPFIYYPLPDNQPQWLNKGHFQLDMSSFYAAGKKDAPAVDLRKGKHIIAFFSLKCPHCKMAAYKMHVMKEKNPSLPIFMVLAGNDKYLPDFWKKTNAQNIPYTRLDGQTFTELVGYSWPVIYFVNNGWVEAETNYLSLNQATIETWMTKP